MRNESGIGPEQAAYNGFYTSERANPMQIEKDRVASFHYELSDADGQAIEKSPDGQPMHYLHGANNIIPGLEDALEGRTAGDEFEVTVEPAEAYGEYNPGNVHRIPLKRLQGAGQLQPGQLLQLQTEQGPMQVQVKKVGRFNVDVDANHPLAGQTLTFRVSVAEVREAAAEELEHGHAHGPGGHQHDDEAPET